MPRPMTTSSLPRLPIMNHNTNRDNTKVAVPRPLFTAFNFATTSANICPRQILVPRTPHNQLPARWQHHSMISLACLTSFDIPSGRTRSHRSLPSLCNITSSISSTSSSHSRVTLSLATEYPQSTMAQSSTTSCKTVHPLTPILRHVQIKSRCF